MTRGIIVGAGLSLAAGMSAMDLAFDGFGFVPHPGEGQKPAKERERPPEPPTEPLVETRQVRRARERREAKGAGR